MTAAETLRGMVKVVKYDGKANFTTGLELSAAQADALIAMMERMWETHGDLPRSVKRMMSAFETALKEARP